MMHFIFHRLVRASTSIKFTVYRQRGRRYRAVLGDHYCGEVQVELYEALIARKQTNHQCDLIS